MWHLGRCFGCSWGWGAGCFFFSSRRRHTRCGRDWSSHVCSSDLQTLASSGTTGETEMLEDANVWVNYKASYRPLVEFARQHQLPVIAANAPAVTVRCVGREGKARSEERRVGKECRTRWSRHRESK